MKPSEHKTDTKNIHSFATLIQIQHIGLKTPKADSYTRYAYKADTELYSTDKINKSNTSKNW